MSEQIQRDDCEWQALLDFVKKRCDAVEKERDELRAALDKICADESVSDRCVDIAEAALKKAKKDTRIIHVRCPSCSARYESAGFQARGQFCLCGWKRK